MWWGIALWMATILVLQELLLPQLTPPQRAGSALLVALPGALMASWRRYCGRYHTITLSPGLLEFHRGTRVEQISPSEVRALLGLGGISLDGGEIVVWKKLILLTEDGNRPVALGADENASCYDHLRQMCPLAWCAPFRGDLEWPHAEVQPFEPGDMSFSLAILRRYYARQMAKTFFLAVGWTLGSIAASVCVLTHAEFNGDVAKGLAWLVVFVIVGIFLLAIVVRQFPVLLRIRRAEHALRRNADGGEGAGGKLTSS